MVYFKVNTLLHQLITLARVQKSFVGCSQLCDRQIISTTDLQLCLRAVKLEIENIESILNDLEEKKVVEKPQTSAKKLSKEAEIAKQIQLNFDQLKLITLSKTQLSEKTIASYRKRLDELLKFKHLTTEEIGKNSEIVMVREHICNHNLKHDSKSKNDDDYQVWKHPDKKVKKDFKIRTFNDVIAYH